MVPAAIAESACRKLILENCLAGAPRNSGIPDSETAKNVFAVKLEKHLDDCRKGQGRLSLAVAKELQQVDQQNIDSLGYYKPDLAKRYLSYRSGMSYDRRARFVNGVDSAVRLLKRVF